MNKRKLIYLSLCIIFSFLLLSWFGIAIGFLLYIFIQKIYDLSFLKKEIVLFLEKGKSITLDRKERLVLIIRYLCALCFDFLDDHSLIKILKNINFTDSYIHAAGQQFLGSVNADWNLLLSSLQPEDRRSVFIGFGGLSEYINSEKSEKFLKDLRGKLDEVFRKDIIIFRDLNKYAEDFEILDAAPGSRIETIKRNYKSLVKNFHPDTSKDLDEQQKKITGEAFIKIHESYNRLKDFYFTGISW